MKYIKVTRSDCAGGFYICSLENAASFAAGELDPSGLDWLDAGESITFTIVEMSELEFQNLGDFPGW